MNRAVQQLEFDASRAGFVHASRGKWKIKCWFCGREQVLEWWHDKHVGRMVRKLMAQGWSAGQNVKPKCFECNKRKDDKMQTGTQPTLRTGPPQGVSTLVTPTVVVTLPPAPGHAGSASFQHLPSPKLTRAIFGMLEDNFDDKRRQYALGWSDDRVAKESGASASYVASLRVGAFGELEDPKAAALKADIETLSTEIGCLRIDTLEKLKALDAKVAKLQSSMNSLSR